MPKALIAGGGIAGAAVAAALARDGWSVTVIERRAELGEIGAGLQMSPNACKVLRHLGVLDRVADRAFRPEAAVLRDGVDGRVIFRAPLGPQAEARWHAPYLHVHRADLLEELIRAATDAGVDFRLGQTVQRTVERPEEIGVHLDGGQILEADMVIGADGIHSAVRGAINPDEVPRFTGQVAWRGLVPTDDLPTGTIAPDATVWAGSGRHLVSYYVRGGTLINFIAVLERETWAEEGWSVPGDPDELRAAFAGWHPAVTELLGQVRECFLWGLFDRPAQVRWTKGRLALIGDAAHPMLPFLAQGAAQALEDAASLAVAVRGTPVAEALVAWEETRWPRVTRVLEQSAANGRMFHQAPGARRAVQRGAIALATKLAPGLAARQLDWLYGADPVGDA